MSQPAGSASEDSWSGSQDYGPLTAAMEMALQIEDSSSLFPSALEPYLLHSIQSIRPHEMDVATLSTAAVPERLTWTTEARQRAHDRLLAEPASLVHAVLYIDGTTAHPKLVPVMFSYAMGFVCLREGMVRSDELVAEKIEDEQRHESLLTLLLQEGCLGVPHPVEVDA